MPDPEARINKSARVFRNQLLAGERAAASDIIRYYGNAWQSIQRALEGVLSKISDAQKAGEDVSPAWMFQADRLRNLQLQIESSMSAFSGQAEAAIVQEQKVAISLAQYHAQNGVLAAMGEPPKEGLYVSWSRLPEEQTQDLIGTLQDGSPLRDLLDSFGDQAQKDAGQTLVNGLAMGKGTREIARDMRRVMGIPLVRALRISRTETLRSYREATRRAYQANTDVVKGWIWHAALDGRTCPMCWAMHGTEHKLEERLNDHPNGRCAMIPKTITWEDITGVPSPLETSAVVVPGEELFKKQTEAVQRKVLGNAGYDAWKDGKVTLKDFVGETPFDKKWGKHRYARSLKNILGGRRS